MDNDNLKPTRSNEIIGFHELHDPYPFFSNWFEVGFNLAGRHYTSSEQFMMYQKVSLAGETELARKIMATDDPKKAKEYAGAQYFKNFDKIRDYWTKHSYHVVKRGVRAKFAQNPELLSLLDKTGNALICECARKDTVWGIGINYNDDHGPIWRDVRNWTGSNQLGRLLMELREEFRYEVAKWGHVQNTDYSNAEPNDIWNMHAGQLVRIPAYHTAILTYADQLAPGTLRDHFYYDCTLNEWDMAMRNGTDCDLPIAGFYEMKQEIYEIAHRLGN